MMTLLSDDQASQHEISGTQLAAAKRALARYRTEGGGEPFAEISAECAVMLADALLGIVGRLT
jgi:hypothetical protein